MNDFANDLLKFLDEFERGDLYPLFIEHLKFGTADIFLDKGNIVGAVRWNISRSGRVAWIEDLFLLPAFDSVKMMRYFGFRGKEKFPKLEYIKFNRDFKQGTKNRVYKLSSLIKG